MTIQQILHHPNVLNQKFPQLALQVIGNFLKKKAYISGASAKATASFKQYKKDVYLQTITRTVTISCNKSGKLY